MAVAGKSVFIVYPHNPEEYVYLDPPPTNDPAVLEEFRQASVALELQQQERIHHHKQLVHLFAQFLVKYDVKVVYDRTIEDTGSQNKMKWFEDALKEVNYIILIVTPSLNTFLKEDVDPLNEPLFTGDFLYNLVHSIKQTKPFLPVFLGREKDISYLPTSLGAASVYQVVQPFHLEPRADDLLKLYALLTGQNPTAPPPSTGPVLLPRRGLRPSPQASHQLGSPDVYTRLSRIQTLITVHQLVAIADKERFNSRWRLLAPLLGLSPAQIEECDVNAGGYGNGEKCLSMLKKWRDNGLYSQQGCITVASLATIVWQQLKNFEMLTAIGECV